MEEKSRNLSIEEFVKVLQLEYLSYKLRSIIYEVPEFKKMNSDIAIKKKEKILNIAKRSRKGTIFDSDRNFETFWKNEFLQEYGLPKLQYSAKKEAVSHWDKVYLFGEGQMITWKGVDYRIKHNNPNENVIEVKKKGIPFIVPYIDVKLKMLTTISIDDLK